MAKGEHIQAEQDGTNNQTLRNTQQMRVTYELMRRLKKSVITLKDLTERYVRGLACTSVYLYRY